MTTPVRTAPAFCLVAVANVAVHLPSPTAEVVLREIEESKRQLTFPIGLAEGVALSHVLSGTRPPRPLTHELFADVLRRYAVEIAAVRLVARRGQTYFAEMELTGRDGHHVVSCRPSDALTLALHQLVPAPVLVDDRLFQSTTDVPPWEPPSSEHGG